MSNDPEPIIQTARQPTLGDRIRTIANQLRQESKVEIQATSRILGAAAQIAHNHDRLIDEVVEMVEEDLEHQAQIPLLEPYSATKLQKQFKTLKDAKNHFAVKASSWAALAAKLNGQSESSVRPASATTPPPKELVIARLETIEREMQAIRVDVNQILNLLELALKPRV